MFPQSGIQTKQEKHVFYHKINRRFSIQEDKKLTALVSIYGENSWPLIASKMEHRNSRQCKDRWCQYLSPEANKTPWTEEEEERLKVLVIELNGKWIEIAKHFNGRADAQIRNKWKTLQRRMGMLPLKKSAASQHQTSPRQATFTYPTPAHLSLPAQPIVQRPVQQAEEIKTIKNNEDIFNFNVFDDFDDSELYLSPDFSYV